MGEAKIMHCHNVYYGGLFDNEKQAAMQVNLLCDKYEIERKNPMIIKEPDTIQQVPNQTSKYIGVSWHKNNKKWEAKMMCNKKLLNGGYFDDEEQAAMSVNLLCDKMGKERKNPMIAIEMYEIQQVPNQTSKYNGVSWHKDKKKWQTQFTYNKKKCCGGYFDNEEQAAMEVNLLCDKNGMERKNPMIDKETNVIQQVNKEIKVEEETMLDVFKHECENRFVQSNEEESSITTAPCKGKKRKRKEVPALNDDVKEKVKVTTPNHDANEVFEKI